MIAEKQNRFVDLAGEVNAGSVFTRSKLESNWTSILAAIPVGLTDVVTRPHVYELKNPLLTAAFAENLLLLLLVIFYLFHSFRSYPEITPSFYFAFMYVLMMFIIIGLVTPVTGAIVRYRAPLFPFFMLLFLILSSRTLIRKSL
jgi:hypothetical protein